MILTLRRIDFSWHARFLQYLEQPLRLPLGVRVIGDMEDQERRNVFAPGNMIDGRQVLLAVFIAKPPLVNLRQFLISTLLYRREPQGQVKRVAVYRHAALDDGERQFLGLQVA